MKQPTLVYLSERKSPLHCSVPVLVSEYGTPKPQTTLYRLNLFWCFNFEMDEFSIFLYLSYEIRHRPNEPWRKGTDHLVCR
ncbi:hypothetical protein RRG08_007919 [Elysia crispata]|uniref:Uncharacterized protein n=1 Tax=Elysia crispata TaxID=231223 RepID=A0AAE1DKS4_9GAST|nr:hypothetical protein RRG08_007919 [Elysia crispata]